MDSENKKKKIFSNKSESIYSHEFTAKYVHPLELDNVDPSKIQNIPIELISPGKYQPREQFDEKELVGLAESIMIHGVMQPITLRPLGNGSSYELIAGERRWRASKLAHIKTIPAIIREISDREALSLGLIENIQRSNLNAIEEAAAFERLISEFGMTHAKVSETVGKSRVSITNTLRLLRLPTIVQESISSGFIQAGHGAALLAAPEEMIVNVHQVLLQEGFSVRQLEAYIQKIKEGEGEQHFKNLIIRPERRDESKLRDLITRVFDEKCEIKFGKNSCISVSFSALDTERLIERLEEILDHVKM